MSEKIKTLFAEDQRDQSVVFSDPSKDEVFRLTPPPETTEKIRLIEESFVMAEQHLGTLRAG